MKERKSILSLGLFLLLHFAYAQDECLNSTFLGQVADYCSSGTQFSTIGSTPSDEAVPSCWNNTDGLNDVWFSFQTTNVAISIKVFGRDQRLNPNGIQRPGIEIYEGPCQALNQVECIASFNNDDRDIILNDIIVGQTYYIRVASTSGNDGPFQLCINNFAPPPDATSDCADGVVLCDKSPFEIEFLDGFGLLANEGNGTCLQPRVDDPSESNSAWYLWICDRPGTLEFDIIPINPNNQEEDLDFALYQLPSGLSDCTNRELLRCMASGETLGAPASQNAPCFGMTGLRVGAGDLEELAGCDSGNDNYVEAIEMMRGETFALLINNFSGFAGSEFGFKIQFDGSGTFQGPSVALEIVDTGDFLACDKEIDIEDISTSPNDPILFWDWNFGVGANPQRSDIEGTQKIVYESFGEKYVALTVETESGCRVTEVIDFFVDPCCEDFEDLEVTTNKTDITCAGENTGVIEIGATGGSPFYEYSTDNITFGPNTIIDSLAAGNYTVYVQDTKGCVNSTTTTIEAGFEYVVDAGLDQIIELGDQTRLFGSTRPANGNFTTTWSPIDSMECSDCLDPIVQPLGTTQYVLTLEDFNGCIEQDTVLIITETDYSIYQPNIITTQDDILNNYFKLFGNKSAVALDELFIYDKWGSLVYEGRNLPINDVAGQGWDGTFNGDPVMNGVYVYKAKVSFLDGVILEYFGDITVVD